LRLSRREFDILVREALDALPPWVQQRLDNVTIAVEDVPPPGEPRDTMGLYVGGSIFADDAFAAPPMVLLFQRPHERLCRTRVQLRREITRTLLHEVAHHFGLEEEELKSLGL
jgi:predicted Zn-dependent protease with MMP-like domain